MTTTTMTAAQAVTEIQEQAERIRSNAPHRFPEAAGPYDAHRQGDLYPRLLPKLPAGAKPIKARLQLAEGDTQGARHCLDSLDGVKMYVYTDAGPLDGPILALTQERVITHPEHGYITLPAGVYDIGYQRDLDAEERERRVQD